MAAYSVDHRPVHATIAATVGDDLAINIGLLDLISGAVTGVGATIVAHVGGTALTVDYSTEGLFACTLTDAQTTTLGVGSHTLSFKLTPAGGDTQTYVSGLVMLGSSATVGGALGYQGGVVNNVLVVVY